MVWSGDVVGRQKRIGSFWRWLVASTHTVQRRYIQFCSVDINKTSTIDRDWKSAIGPLLQGLRFSLPLFFKRMHWELTNGWFKQTIYFFDCVRSRVPTGELNPYTHTKTHTHTHTRIAGFHAWQIAPLVHKEPICWFQRDPWVLADQTTSRYFAYCSTTYGHSPGDTSKDLEKWQMIWAMVNICYTVLLNESFKT